MPDTLEFKPVTLDDVRAVVREALVATPSPWMNAREAARYLRVSHKTIERARRAGRLQACHINGGQKLRYHRADLDSFMRCEGQ
jgi:excisionase family DNA binding protein